MGSCSSNREEINETVEGGAEVQNCLEIEKEIGVAGGDPTEDIMIGDIMDGGDDLMFSGEEGLFPSLPDFACLSSPVPSSASINLPQNQSASSSSSSSSSSPWAYVDAPGPAQGPNMQQQQHQQEQGRDMRDQTAVPSAEAAADDISTDFELWDPSNPLDPSFLFADDYDTAIQAPPQHCLGDQSAAAGNGDGDGNSGSNGCSDGSEMGKIFFEWLMNNRDVISVEELRSIRLRRSTIDYAAARLGPGDKGRQELLRLILAWVQNHHLSKIKKRRMEAQDQPPHEPVPQFCNSQQPQQNQVGPLPSPPPPAYHFPALSDATANPNPNPNLNYKNCEGGWNMNPMPPVPAMPLVMAPAGEAASMNPYHQYYQSGSTSSIVVSSQPLSSPPDFCSFSPPPPIQYPPFPSLGIPCMNPIPPQYPGGFGSQYPVYLSPALSGAALATKEARKKRMARQRRSSFLRQHKHQSHSHRSSSNADATGGEKANLRVGNEGGENSLSTHIATNNNNVKDWAFWPSGRQRNLPTSASAVGSAALLPAKTSNNGASSDKLQGPKKNLRFLLQKVLKQSDVGSLGRIVLPKKEAEIHLPELDSRDGMSIPMEDIGTSQVWNMKYRFWPNNKSRMYLLENTGDFVRSNGLQEGDFIVIYSDVKRNKYLIRGVKVRQPTEPKEVVAAGISLKPARVHLKNSAGHLNGASRATAVCDMEKNNESEDDEVLPSYGDEDGGAPPTVITVDNI